MSNHVPDRESVVAYAGALGCRHDDISFLDCKYANIKFQTNRIMAKLEQGYEVCDVIFKSQLSILAYSLCNIVIQIHDIVLINACLLCNHV